MKIIVINIALLMISTLVYSQEVLYKEYFTDGSLSLDWYNPWPPEGTAEIEVDFDESTPGGDGWVGSISNAGMVGTTLAGPNNLEDYRIDAWIYVTVGEATRHGVVARWDTTGGIQRYYVLYADFNSGGMPPASPAIKLKQYPVADTLISGVDLGIWDADTLPGGIPGANGWHKMSIECLGSQISAWWDDKLLPGCPVEDTVLAAGSFGLYVFNFGGETATLADNIVVTDTITVENYISPGNDGKLPISIKLLSSYPNPFNPSTTITVNSNGLSGTALVVYDILGRNIATLFTGDMLPGIRKFSFDAEGLTAGTYYVVLQSDSKRQVEKIVLLK